MELFTHLPKSAKVVLRSLLFAVGAFCVTAYAASAQNVPCPPNLDFENGNLNNWECSVGLAQPGTPATNAVVFGSPMVTGPLPTRHIIQSAAPITLDPYGHFPTTPPGGGNYALKLGRDSFSLACERVQYYVHVPIGSNDYSFNYRFAPVLQDPDFGNTNPATWTHQLYERPTFRISVFDSATGATIPCDTQTYVASPDLVSLYGFKVADTGFGVIYLPWTSAALPIINQGGKTLVIRVEALDCTAGGHWGYGYFDVVSCGTYKAALSYCNLDSGIVRFIGTGVKQDYNWYKSNGTFLGKGAFIDVPIPSTPDYFYGVLAAGSVGCIDTIYTDTVSNFILNATPALTCARFGTPIQLDAIVTGGLSAGSYTYSWDPNPDLSSRTIRNPLASPVDTTHYVVTVSDKVGCYRTDTVYVMQAPNAGPDLAVCPLGERPVQLHVSGPIGASYHWYANDPSLPAADYLNCTDCPNPVAAPVPSAYTYLVGYDGCPTLDTMVVYHDTSTTISAPQDSLIVCRPGYVNLLSATTGPSPYMNLACGTYNPITCAPQDQDTSTIGTGLQGPAKTTNTPLYSEKRYMKYQFIIPKRDLLNSGFYSGTINSMAFRTLNLASLGGLPLDFYTINLGCVPYDTFPKPLSNASFITGTTQVGAYTAVTLIPNDWNQFDFSTPYTWDTSMNLLVDICLGPMTTPNAAGKGNDPVAMMDGYAIQKADDIINVCGGNVPAFKEYFQRPVVRFNYCPSPVLPFKFAWLPGTYLNDSMAQNPTAYVPRSIDYAVYTIGRNGCKVRDILHIKVPNHTLNLWAQDTFACVQQPVFMHASGADAYQWFEVHGGVFTDASGSLTCTTCDNPTATPPVTTQYAVVYTNEVHQGNAMNPNYEIGCPDTLYTTVNIWPLPNVVSTNNDTTITFGQSVHLYASGASHYSWTPVGSLSDPNSPAPIAAPTATTQYVVSGMDTNGCVSKDTVLVIVNYNANLLIPSAFTPNGDGRNDEFRIVNATFQRLMEFRVFNRWGQEVFSTTDITKGWDGTWKGVPQDMGAYQYLIRVAYPDNRVETYKGDVSLVK